LFCFSLSCVPYVVSFSGLFLFCFSSSRVHYVISFSILLLFCFSSSRVPYVVSFSEGTQDKEKQNNNNPEKLTT
jgi:hypothetical protein